MSVFLSATSKELEAYRLAAHSAAGRRDLGLRSWPVPAFPERPYPVLLPYQHPQLLAGRERELAEVSQLLRLPVPILGLYAPSGAGKSSLLAAGLVPRLRADGLPVAFERHPDEPGIAHRLIGDLLEPVRREELRAPIAARMPDVADGDRSAFVDHLRTARRLAGEAPVLVLDQFEDLLRPGRGEPWPARAVVGSLLAASVERHPGIDGPLCRWLLAYRREFHGKVTTWLRDVLYESRSEDPAGVSDLPHDLSGPDRFQAWQLPCLGAPERGGTGAAERARTATETFLSAIETPLELRLADGRPRYPWRFAGDGAARLARAFGRARAERPDAPLVPELQVVLAHLLECADDDHDAPGGRVIRVPEEPGDLIGEAMEEHLRRALDVAFPAGPATSAPAHRQRRTRALLALRELADVHGRREAGLPAAALARAIGPDGDEILEKLSAPSIRLVVLEGGADDWRYVLSHDRMAEVIVRLSGEEGRFASPELLAAFHQRLAVDEELLELRRQVALKTELYRSGETRQATAMSRAHYRQLEANRDAFLWNDDQRRWWDACRRRRRGDRRRRIVGTVGVALALAALSAAIWTEGSRRARRAGWLEQLSSAEPPEALSALLELANDSEVSADAIREAWRRRSPRDLFERGAGGLEEARRGESVLTAAELALPLLKGELADVPLLASLTWALDFFPGRDPALAERARELREAAVRPLRRLREPPPRPGLDDPGWVTIPAGAFAMGTGPDEPWTGDSFANERPRHPVAVSAFRMMTHEVTREAFARLFAESSGTPSGDAGRLPAAGVDWYSAYAYAAWLGGRLPTEAEWEYAARAGCAFEHCTRTGAAATLDQVAWHRRNAFDPRAQEAVVQPVAGLEPNPWGLFDMFGNVWEWTADWYGPYGDAARTDPMGPAAGEERTMRGGGFWVDGTWARAGCRLAWEPGWHDLETGFRVVLPLERTVDPAASSGRSES